MTTHAGLGANTALRDAIELAQYLQTPNWRKGLHEYETTMIKRGMNHRKPRVEREIMGGGGGYFSKSEKRVLPRKLTNYYRIQSSGCFSSKLQAYDHKVRRCWNQTNDLDDVGDGQGCRGRV